MKRLSSPYGKQLDEDVVWLGRSSSPCGQLDSAGKRRDLLFWQGSHGYSCGLGLSRGRGPWKLIERTSSSSLQFMLRGSDRFFSVFAFNSKVSQQQLGQSRVSPRFVKWWYFPERNMDDTLVIRSKRCVLPGGKISGASVVAERGRIAAVLGYEDRSRDQAATVFIWQDSRSASCCQPSPEKLTWLSCRLWMLATQPCCQEWLIAMFISMSQGALNGKGLRRQHELRLLVASQQ